MSRDLILVALSLLFWGLGEGLFFFFIPLTLQQLGATPLMIGGVFSGIGLVTALTQIPAGILSDKIGPRTIMWLSWGMGVLAGWLLAVSRTLNIFILGIWFYFLTAFGAVPLNSYVTRARGRLSPERALTFTGGMYNLGYIVGPVVGGILASRFGLQRIYFYSALVFILSTIIIFFIHALPVERHPEPVEKSRVWKNPRLFGFLLLVFSTIFILYLPQPLTPNFLQNQQGLSTTQIGLLGTIGGIGNTLTLLILGSLKAYWGILVGEAMVLFFSFALWKGTGLGWYGFAYFMLAGYRLVRSMLVGFARPMIHPAQVGIVFGLMETSAGIAIILAPLLAGVLYQVQPISIYLVGFLLTLVSIVLNFRVLPGIKEKGFIEDA
jgi:MFS family permease